MTELAKPLDVEVARDLRFSGGWRATVVDYGLVRNHVAAESEEEARRIAGQIRRRLALRERLRRQDEF